MGQEGTGEGVFTHLVRGAIGGCQRVLPVIDKHDEASEAAEAEHNLLAGEHGVAGAAGAVWVSDAGSGRGAHPSRRDPQSQPHSQLGLPFAAGTEVALHLRLVHPVQR